MSLESLKARLEKAKGTSVQIDEKDKEEADLLLALEGEAERLKLERAAAQDLERRRAHFAVRERFDAEGATNLPIDSFVLSGFGAFVVRAPSATEQRTMLDGVRGKNPDAAEATFACTITEYPDRKTLQSILTESPLVVKTIVNLGMSLGGLRQEGDLRKSG